VAKTRPMLLVIRHGATDWNKEGGGTDYIRGWEDIPVDDEGVQEAEKLGEGLATFPISKIYHSNLERAEYTANAIADLHIPPLDDFSVIPTEELRSWNLGDFVGQPYDAKTTEMLKKYQKELPWRPVPGGESWLAFVKPWLRFLKRRLNEAKRNTGAIALVTHTWNIRTLDGHLARDVKNYEIDPSFLWAPTRTKPGKATLYIFDGKKWV